jgi:hypothetical protein
MSAAKEASALCRLLTTLVAFAIGAGALAGPAETTLTVDLRDPAALAQLERSNPEHYRKIRQILAGLLEQPARAESNWLQTTFGASDVELSRYLFKTSYPPKQALRFRLDNVRYTMHVTRSDIVARPAPSK